MKLVIDASVALKWFFHERPGETNADAARDILQGYVSGRHDLLQPVHFCAEVCAVLAREAAPQMRENLRDLLELAIPTRDDALVMWRAMQISDQLKHHVFDTLYHAVALESADTVLVSADEVYCRKAAGFGRVLALSAWSVQ